MELPLRATPEAFCAASWQRPLKGFTFNVGPSANSSCSMTDDEGIPTTTTIDHGSYFELGPVDRGEDARRDICLTLEVWA